MSVRTRLAGAAVRLADLVPPSLARRATSSSRISRLLRPLANRVLPARLAAVTVRSGPAAGLRIQIDPRSEKYYWTGAYETEVQRYLAERLRPGGVFWDVGAHCGFFACLAARLVGPDGAVLAFEPAPANLVRLEDTIRRNGVRVVEPRPEAVTDRAGTVHLHAGKWSTTWSLVDGAGGDVLQVPAITLDDAAAGGARLPDLVKIDVEGAELAVLRGAAGLARGRRPTFVVELHRTDPSDAAALLPGYDGRRLGERQWAFEPRAASTP